MKIPLRNQLPAVLKITAIIIGIVAQVLIAKHLYIALGLWLAALAVFFFSIRKTSSSTIPTITVNPAAHEKISQWAYILGAVSVVFSCLSFYLFSTDLPNIYAWIIHIFSIMLILVSVIVFTSSKKKKAAKTNKWHWFEIAALIAVILLAIFLRFYKLSELPYGLWFDEADNGLNALKIFSDPKNIRVLASTLPTHLIFLMNLSIKVFGQTIFAIRAVTALIGVGTVAAAYLVGNELFNRKMGIFLAFFLAISRWDLIHSRIGMHGVSVPLFELLTIGLLLRALRLQRYKDYLLAGLSLGFGLCFYVPLRLFPIIVILLLVLIWMTHPEFIKNSWRHLLVFLFGVFVISVPLTQYAVFQADDFWGRTSQVSVFKDRTFQEGIQTVLRTTGEHVAMFTYKGDRNGRHNIPSQPMLDLVTGTLFILGIAFCLFKIKKPVSILLLCWLFMMLSPGILSLDFESPQSLRAIGSLPAAYLLSIIPIHALLEDQKQVFKHKKSILIVSSLFLVVFTIGVLNYYAYFIRQANSSESWTAHSTPDTIIAREMQHYGNQVDYFVSTFYYGTPTIRFLAPAVTDYYRIETHETYPFLLDGQHDAVFFLDRDRKPVFEQIKKVYPNAIYTEYKSPTGSIVLYEVYLTKTDIQSVQGLSAKYFSTSEMNEEPFINKTINQLNIDWSQSTIGALPFYADFSGVLFVESFGSYQFKIEAPSNVELFFDGKLAIQSTGGVITETIELAKGVHSIEIKATGGYGKFQVSWQPPDGEIGDISASNLFIPPVTNNGLLGSYYPNAEWGGIAELIQVDPFIHFYFHNPPLERPYTVEWNGKIFIENAGIYELGTESIDGSQLFIDDNLILDNQTLNKYHGNSIDLSEGFHTIKIRFSDLTSHTHVNLYWKPPESDLNYIPSEVLFLP